MENLSEDGVNKKQTLLWVIEIGTLLIGFALLGEIWFQNWFGHLIGLLSVLAMVAMVGLIIMAIVSIFIFKRFKLFRFAPIATIILLFFFTPFIPYGWIKATIEFNKNSKAYLQIVNDYKNGLLKTTYPKSSSWVNLPSNDSYLSTGGSIMVQRSPLTLLFYRDRDTEDPTGILYREGSIKVANSPQDSTSLTSFLLRDFHIWKIQDNWYWIETYTVHEAAP